MPITYRYQFTCTAHTFSSNCSLLWMPSILAHQVPTVLQVPIQATQHKDDTNPSCISSVLFRVLVIILFSRFSFIPAHQVPIQATQHKDDTLYPSLAYLLFVLFRVLHQAEALRSHTPPQRLEVILFTESPNSCDSPLMCVERVLTKSLTSRHPQNA